MDVDLAQVLLPPDHIASASASLFLAAAACARQLAEQEEQEVQRLVATALHVQAQKVDVKLKHLEELSRVGACCWGGCLLLWFNHGCSRCASLCIRCMLQ